MDQSLLRVWLIKLRFGRTCSVDDAERPADKVAHAGRLHVGVAELVDDGAVGAES